MLLAITVADSKVQPFFVPFECAYLAQPITAFRGLEVSALLKLS